MNTAIVKSLNRYTVASKQRHGALSTIQRFNRLAVQRGFTLIEAILAVGVSAVVLVTISAVFFGALNLRARTTAALDDMRPIDRSLDLLRHDLENAVPPGTMIAGPLQSGAVSGLGTGVSDGSIQIYTTTGQVSANLPWGDVQRVIYQLEDSTNAYARGKDLYRSVTRNLLSTATEESDDQWLASGIDNLKFSYYDGANWLDSWDASATTNLPVAVRVTLQLAGADTAPAPQPLQMVVPLAAQSRTNQTTTGESQ